MNICSLCAFFLKFLKHWLAFSTACCDITQYVSKTDEEIKKQKKMLKKKKKVRVKFRFLYIEFFPLDQQQQTSS